MSKPSSKSTKKSAQQPSTKGRGGRAPRAPLAAIFPYAAVEPKSRDDILRPLVPLRLRSRRTGVRLPIYGLIDSGADESLFPLHLATALGIDLSKGETEKFETAGGVVEQHVWKAGVYAEIPALDNARVKLSAWFTPGLSPRMILLGRHDFFRHFRVTLDEKSQTFMLQAYPLPKLSLGSKRQKPVVRRTRG